MPALSTASNKRLFDRDFQRLAMLSAVSLTGFGILLLAIVAFAGWSSNEAATQRERVLLQNALNRSIARTLNEQKSVAWWDDAVTKITAGSIDLEFTDSNFGVFLTETYGHEEVYILDGNDRPLYAFAEGRRGEPALYERRRGPLAPLVAQARGVEHAGLTQRPDAFGADQKDYRTLAGAVRTATWAGHIMSIDGKLAIVAGLTIVPNVDLTLLSGTPKLLISIVNIDDDYVSGLGRLLLLPDLALTGEPMAADGVVSVPFIGDDQTQSGYLSWTTQQPGKVLLSVILPLLAAGVIGVAILASRMLRRLRSTSMDLATRESQAQHAALHDGLSGLPNRGHFAKKLRSSLGQLGGESSNQLLIAYLDIDRFKDVNDTLGHHAGDQLIKAVAERIRAHLRADDFLSRYGGDEFAVLCRSDAPNAIEGLSKRIAQAFELPFDVEGQELSVTSSIGVAIAPDHGTSVDDLMRHADIALYEAKTQGRDRAVPYSQEMGELVEERRAIELDLKAAIESDALRLSYQPIISCSSGEVSGVEALLRWRHCERGELSPATFIPIAEHSGLMPALGEWVLIRAMKDSRRWPDLQISVNLSPAQFRQPGLKERLQQLVHIYGADPKRFVLEITEGVLMESTDATRKTLEAIHAMGFKTALDDFGTGYSSLAYLCNFRFDKIKIDRSFVIGMAKSESYRKIVHSIVALGKGLGLEIVAEGVETESDALNMTAYGCSELQGYFFAKPLDVEPLDEFLKSFSYRLPAATARLSAYTASRAAAV